MLFRSLVWSSSDKAKVSVQNGKITALGAGTVKITAMPKDGSNVKAECTVKVLEPGKLSCRTDAIAWNDLVYGYADVDAENIDLENSGESNLTDIQVSLRSGNNFQITSYPAGQITAGQTTSVSVRPVAGLGAGRYSDTLVITTKNGLANISLTAVVGKAENTASVTLSKEAVTASSITVDSQISGTDTGAEYAIASVDNASADNLTWQDSTYFAGLKEIGRAHV